MRRFSRRRNSIFWQRNFTYMVVFCGVVFLIIYSMKLNEFMSFQRQTRSAGPREDSSNNFQDGYRAEIGIDSAKSEIFSNISNRADAGYNSDIYEISQDIPPHVSINFTDNGKKSDKYFYTNVIVHFDLKGAPPKVGYFLRLLDIVAKSGATGVLIEWEDMFPWSGEVSIARNKDAYTVTEVRAILGRARNLGLEVIPLVQTFGHLEWILKYEKFRRFRENDEYPQVLCIGNKNAVELIKQVINQVVKIHKPFGLKRFHIGADEVFEYGVCPPSRNAVTIMASLYKVAISYLETIATHVKNVSDGATVLAWHDMLKTFPSDDLEDSKLRTLLQPVIWDYSEGLVMASDMIIVSLAEKFEHVWASSAFKGANTPSSKFMDLEHYKRNNLQWIAAQQQLRENWYRTKIEGMIITGWSRYDHMARLCEILPIGTPSMVMNIQIALIGAHKAYAGMPTENIATKALQEALRILDYNKVIRFDDRDDLNGLFEDCNFTGKEVYNLLQHSWRAVEIEHEQLLAKNHHVMGWLSPYHIRYNISQKWYLYQIASSVELVKRVSISTAKYLENEMLKLFHSRTVDEFFFENIDPLLENLNVSSSDIQRLLNVDKLEQQQFTINRYSLEQHA